MNGHDMLTIMQGDQIPIGIRLEDDAGESIPDTDVAEVVITLGNKSRKMTDEVLPVTYDAEEELWIFMVTQEDTFALDMGVHSLEARVEFGDGNTDGAHVAAVYVLPSGNKEVLNQ